MGYMRHDAIVLTSWDASLITRALEKAAELKMNFIGPSKEGVNGQVSALICPDGSKEGWAESEQGDVARDEFIEWTKTVVYSDGSSSLHWVEVSFGGDEPELTNITRFYKNERKDEEDAE